MNYAASTTCPHCNQVTKWGTCNAVKSDGSICKSKGFPYENGYYYCIGCKTVFKTRKCEHCGKEISADVYKGGTGCFIATAVYESPSAPEVMTLRQFRDEVLLQSKAGQIFVAIYYRISPPLAHAISKSRLMKKMARNYILEPIVKVLKKSTSKITLTE